MRRGLFAIVACGFVVVAAAASPAAAQPAAPAPAISITGDGTLIVQGAAEVPAYSAGGRWVEGQPRTSARNAVRLFRFLGSSGPPAIEVYVNRDLTNAAPDGAFETGLVQGFLGTFAAGVGFTPGPLVVEDTTLGGAPVKRCRAELTKGGQKVWLYAWIFPRNPSVTFLALRPQASAGAEIETYLQSVRFR